MGEKIKALIESLLEGMTRVETDFDRLHITAYWVGSVIRIDITGYEKK